MSLLHLLSYVGFIAAGAFVILSLASGLLWLSELIEEHSRLAKVIGIRAVYTIITLHVLLYITDSLPLPQIIFSIVAHGVYLQNFAHTWPYIALASPAFAGSCLLALGNHFLWFFYFSQRSRAWHAAQQAGRYGRGARASAGTSLDPPPGFAEVATFFGVCVWFVPLFLFLSLSANDNALPMSNDEAMNSPTLPIQASRTSLFKNLLDHIPWLRRRRGPPEGILVTHTPTHSAPSSPRLPDMGTSSSTGMGFYSMDAVRSVEDFQRKHRVTLRPPPKRSQTVAESGSRASLEGRSSPGTESALYTRRVHSPDAVPVDVRRRTVIQQ